MTDEMKADLPNETVEAWEKSVKYSDETKENENVSTREN